MKINSFDNSFSFFFFLTTLSYPIIFPKMTMVNYNIVEVYDQNVKLKTCESEIES